MMMVRALLGFVLGIVARLWLATLRVRLEVHPALEQHADVPWVLSFFHGTQWPLLAWRRRRSTVVMVSHSADGAMQARALGLLGFLVVRGSSSRGGARGLASMVRLLRRGGMDAAFAVDGPRGPYGEPKPGAAVLAARSGGILVPMGSAVEVGRGKTFTRAWDRFVLAWPFSRVAVVLGAPVPEKELAEAIREANRRAARNVLALQSFLEQSCSVERSFAAELNGHGGSEVYRSGSPRSLELEEENGNHA